MRLLPAFAEWEEVRAEKEGVELTWGYALFPKNLKWAIDRANQMSRTIYEDKFDDETLRAVLNGEERYELAVEVVESLYFDILMDPASILPKAPPENPEAISAWLKDFSSARWWHVALGLDQPGDGQKAISEATFKSWLSGNAMSKKAVALVIERAHFWYAMVGVVCDIHQAAYLRHLKLSKGDEYEKYHCVGVQTELKKFVDRGATEDEIAREHRRLWDIAQYTQRLPDYQKLTLVGVNKRTTTPEFADAEWAKYYANDRKLDLAEPDIEWGPEEEHLSYDTRMWPVAVGTNPLAYSYRRDVQILSRVRKSSAGHYENLGSRIVRIKTLVMDANGLHRRRIDGEDVHYTEEWEDCPEHMDSYEKLWDGLELLMSRRRHAGAGWHTTLVEPPIVGVRI